MTPFWCRTKLTPFSSRCSINLGAIDFALAGLGSFDASEPGRACRQLRHLLAGTPVARKVVPAQILHSRFGVGLPDASGLISGFKRSRKSSTSSAEMRTCSSSATRQGRRLLDSLALRPPPEPPRPLTPPVYWLPRKGARRSPDPGPPFPTRSCSEGTAIAWRRLVTFLPLEDLSLPSSNSRITERSCRSCGSVPSPSG